MNIYLIIAIAVYLIIGASLSYSLFANMHTRKRAFHDWLWGPLLMPLIFLAGLIFMACEKLWARLLPLLDFEKPEEMRAGPVEPGPKPNPHDAG